MRLPYEVQLTRAINFLLEHAGPDSKGIIRGGSIPNLLKQKFQISGNRANNLNHDLRTLGLRETTRQGTRYTHTLKPPTTGEVTAEDASRAVHIRDEQYKHMPSRQARANPDDKQTPDKKEAISSNKPTDVDVLLKVVERLEEGAKTTSDLVKTLQKDVETEKKRANDAEAECTRLRQELSDTRQENATLSERLTEVERRSADPRVQALRTKYNV